MLINNRERVGIKKLKSPKEDVDFSRTVDDVDKNLEDDNPTKKRRLLILLDDRIADMEFNKKIKSFSHLIVSESKKLNILLAFFSQYYFKNPKTIRLNATHYFNTKASNKRGIQKIASNHSSAIDFGSQ